MRSFKFTQLRMAAITILTAAVVFGTTATLPAQTTPDNVLDSSTLDGTWNTLVTFEDNTMLHVLFTFIPGRDDGQGALVDQNEYQYTPNPVCTADQGVWRRTGSRRFIATHFAFCFDATQGYIPAGNVRVRDTINLSHNGSSFDGTQFVEAFDVNGNLVFSIHATMHGTKISAQPPPAADVPSTGNPNFLKMLRRPPTDEQ